MIKFAYQSERRGAALIYNIMKRIAIVADDVALPGEKGLGRLYYLACLMQSEGLNVELITADFQHWEKRRRSSADISRLREQSPVKLTFIHELTYSRNIDPKRIVSYRVLGKNCIKYLKTQRYDLVYALIPDNHLCALTGKYAAKNNIPFVVDVEDLWPEAMRMALDVPLLSDILFSYFSVNAKKAYTLADAVVGSSDEYRDEPKKYKITPPQSLTCYVGSEVSRFFSCAAENRNPDIDNNIFRLCYAGTLGTSYDIDTLIEAVAILNKKGYTDISCELLGDGPLREQFELNAKRSGANVNFHGYLPFEIMAARISECDVTVNSLVAKASQSIVSKIGDYLAAGKPMINTGLNKEFCEKVTADGFGINVPPHNAAALADAILRLYGDRELCEKMSEAARRVSEQFDRPKTYLNIVRMVKRLCGENTAE